MAARTEKKNAEGSRISSVIRVLSPTSWNAVVMSSWPSAASDNCLAAEKPMKISTSSPSPIQNGRKISQLMWRSIIKGC